MSKYNLVSVNRIISKSVRAGLEGVGVSESDTIEMIGEALEFIGAFGQYEEEISFLKVEDHKARLPDDLIEVIQIAYKYDNLDKDDCVEDVTYNCEDDCEKNEVTQDCWSQHNRYYIPEQRYYDVIASHNIVNSFNDHYYNEYRPLKLNKSTFRAAMGMHSKDSINLYCDGEESYTIQNGFINTSFQSGTLCVAYLKQPLDDQGYPMIPDNISYSTAITAYLKYQMSDLHFFRNATPENTRKLQQYLADWHWYCKQAKNSQLMPDTLDEREALYKSNMRLVKKRDSYGSFFSSTNTLDNFKFNVNGRFK